MNKSEDWTVFPVGTKFPEGDIVECPYCGRAALLVEHHSIPFYNHRLGAFPVGDKVEIIEDSCPQSPAQ